MIALIILGPVICSHRVSVEQMVILEPGLAETVSITLLSAIREAMDEVVRRGVPAEAARDSIFGHIGAELTIIFGEIDAKLSDGVIMPAERGASVLLQPHWKRLFDMDSIMNEVLAVTSSE